MYPIRRLETIAATHRTRQNITDEAFVATAKLMKQQSRNENEIRKKEKFKCQVLNFSHVYIPVPHLYGQQSTLPYAKGNVSESIRKR